MGDRADLIEVFFLRLIHADLPLGHQEDLLVRFHGPFQGRNGDGTLHIEGEVHMGKHRQAAQGQNGDIQCRRFHRGIVPFLGIKSEGDAMRASP